MIGEGGVAMSDQDNLHRTYARVADFRYFDPGQRIWWIYLRVAVEQWLERNEDPDIRIAYDRLKSFPENLPDERESWLTLRAAVAQLLARL